MTLILKNAVISFLISLVMFGSCICGGLNPDKLSVEKMPFEKGISHELTYCIFQDTKGFIWLGTMFGLVRYDGRDYRVYRNDASDSTSISFDDVLTIFEDHLGNLWIGTWGGGLNKFNYTTEKFTRYIHNPANQNTISDNIVWAITEDGNGNIWAGTNSGLNKLDPVKGKFYKEQLQSKIVKSLLYDSKGRLWVGSNSGLMQYDFGQENYKTILFDQKASVSKHITSIYEDDNHAIWVGTQSGLYKFVNTSEEFISYKSGKGENTLSSNIILSITEDENKDIWIGTVSGLNKLDHSKNIFFRYYHSPIDETSISSNVIQSLITDRSGIVWISAYEGGLNKLNLGERKFNTYRFEQSDNLSLRDNNVRAIAEDIMGNVWIGTFGGGINVFNKDKKTFFTVRSPENYVTSLTLNKNNLLWIGGRSGISCYDILKKRTKELPWVLKKEFPKMLMVNTLLAEEDGTLLIGTAGGGLFIYKDNRLQHYGFNGTKPSKAPDFIISIYKSNKGEVWLGTYAGLIRFNETNGSYSILSHNNSNKSLSNNYVFSINADSKGDLWAGTGNGLNKYNPKDSSFTKYFEKDGLPSNVIKAILEDSSGNLWISTAKGLSKFNIKSNSFDNFDNNDGLQGNLFNVNASIKGKDGCYYFGGNMGMSTFFPGRMIKSGFNSPVYITSVYNENYKVPMADNSIKLKYDKNSIRIEFASLDYTNPEKNQYQYILTGFDENWKGSGRLNFVRYTNLPPGKYTFKVKGTNSDGVYSSSIATLNLEILPPFWRTWWFYLISAAVIISIIIFVHFGRVRNAIRLQKVREEENEKIRRKTALDFHDELGHRLTRISLLTELVKRNIPPAVSEVIPLLDNITVNSNELYEGTKDFIWSIDPYKDSLYELLIRLKDFGDEIFSHTEVNFSFIGINDELKDIKLAQDKRREIALIFKEAMNNSLKHACAKNVKLSIEAEGRIFCLRLEDDGRGFSKEEAIKGNGLSNMKKRAEKILLALEINSSPFAGTKISLEGNYSEKSLDYE